MPYKLIITGEISVERYDPRWGGHNWCILILGPTGAGKSSFIEALAGEGQSLGISKDQLAGFTQEVTAYKVKNAGVQSDDTTFTLCLIDAPGFSDTKIPELEIITKVKQWLNDRFIHAVYGVLYLSPITDTRAPGSKRRTIKMIQSLLNNQDSSLGRVNIVTTMWDRLSNPLAKERAETNFAQLQDDIWKRPISGGAKISRYHNDFDSAIQILRSIIDSAFFYHFPLGCNLIKSEDTSAPLLYQELLDRISNTHQERKHLQQEKMDLITNPDPLLELDVLSRLPEVQDSLAKFLGQLVAFGTPPPEFEGIPERCVYQNLLDQVNSAREEHVVLEAALTDLQINLNPAREATLRGQLEFVEHDLVDHIKRLVKHGTPPKGYKTAMERALVGVPLGTVLKYRVEKGLRSFKDTLGFRSRPNSEGRR